MRISRGKERASSGSALVLRSEIKRVSSKHQAVFRAGKSLQEAERENQDLEPRRG
jgi:hypothetical protein